MIADGTPFLFGEHRFEFGVDAVELTDSYPIRDDAAALRARLAVDGYLFIRGFHPSEKARRAAQWTLEAIDARGGLRENTPVERGVVGEGNRNFPFFRDLTVCHAPAVLDVVDSAETFAFYERLFGKPVLTFDKRWLRSMAHGGHNHFHYDQVYVGRGTKNRLSMWTALTDIDLGAGGLVVCLGSNRHERLIETYGATDMDRDLTDAVFSADPRELVDDFGFRLGTAHFEPGDVVIFGMHTMHSTAPNCSDRYRISIDTRYQPADEAVDERFFFRTGPGGERRLWLGNFYRPSVTYRSMDSLRKAWDI